MAAAAAPVVSELELLEPPVRPGKIICIGLNYKDHAEESGLTVPEQPMLFAKLPSSVIGSGHPVRLPSISSRVDFEAELGVEIGRPARAVSEQEALDHVAGYTCVNDVSARDLQLGDGWIRGKGLDTFCPLGPTIASPEHVGDPQALSIRCLLNGAVVQESTTAAMIFSVAEIVSFVSQAITLECGDLICTGTPAGVGMARTPKLFLNDGDRVRVEIDRIGAIENPVVGGSAS